MVEIDDLRGAWEVFVGKIPDPEGSVAKHDTAVGLVESPPSGLTDYTRNGETYHADDSTLRWRECGNLQLHHLLLHRLLPT